MNEKRIFFISRKNRTNYALCPIALEIDFQASNYGGLRSK
jgi:hypothetical protein